MTTLTPRDVALRYISAVGDKRLDAVEELLHPDLEFHMSGKSIHGSHNYIAALRRLGPILLRNEVRETIVDADTVCIVYDFVTDTHVGAVPSVEWLTVTGGRIRSSRLIFHKEQWPTVLEELGRRMAATA